MSNSNNISVAMATFNGESFLREQMDSILNQTIDFKEIIICDDKSTDNTWHILQEYAAKDNRIKIFQNDSNIGLVKNFENAILKCSGDLIALSDQDDIWLPKHLEILMNGLGEKDIAMGDAEIINGAGQRLNMTLSYCECRDFTPDNDLEKAYSLFFYRGWFQGASMLIRKSFFNIALPIPNFKIYHDYWFGCLACFCNGVNYIPEVITLYRRHDQAVTGKKKRSSKIKTQIGHILTNKVFKERPLLIDSIIERRGYNLTSEQMDFLKVAKIYFDRRKTLIGRIKNSFFEIKNYKLIYSEK